MATEVGMTQSRSNSSGPLPEIADVLKLHELVKFFYGFVAVLASSATVSPVERRQLRQAGLVLQRVKRRSPICSVEVTFEASFDDGLAIVGGSRDPAHVACDGMICDDHGPDNNCWYAKKTVPGKMNCPDNRIAVDIILHTMPTFSATRTLGTPTAISTASATTTTTAREWTTTTTCSRSTPTAAGGRRPSAGGGARRSCRRSERRAAALTRG